MKITRKVEVWLEAPLENVWAGLWMVGSGLWHVPGRAQVPARDTR